MQPQAHARNDAQLAPVHPASHFLKNHALVSHWSLQTPLQVPAQISIARMISKYRRVSILWQAPSSESSSESKPQSQSLQSQEPTVAAPSSDSSSYTLPQVRKCQCCCHPVMSTKAVQTALPQFTVSTQRSSTLLQFSQAHSCRCCCHYSMSTTAVQTAPDLKQLASSSSQTTKSCLLVSRRKTGVQVHLGATIRISVASQTTFR
ncbi:uncharacterized protein LOC119450709 isoform X1 [Dermacentor silvarum]|uniref:uncharacterized protein LOC119450709 isoform X1 n=1 Tax=Dermacentor silvarum TaxID=543639 RepID=UPI002100FE67|nr:uncharacterized protein LOC119450709 isoform X1 [Dermacentor silvarum]